MSDPPIRTALVVAAISAVGIGFLVVAVCFLLRTDRVNQETLAAVTAWSALATALATALLFVGAALAALRVGDQIRQAERHHMDSLRPLLDFTDEPLASVAQDASSASGGRVAPVTVRLHNIGLGPATNVRVDLWVLPMHSIQDAADALQLFSRAGLEESSPHYKGGWNSLAVAAQSEVPLERMADLPRDPVLGAYGINVLARFSCSDFFGRTLVQAWEVRGVRRS